jgi:ABC-type sulfate transport system permease component
MKPRDIFGLILRLMGLLFIYNALDKVPLAISSLRASFGMGLYTTLMIVVWPLLIAFWLFRGAPPISRMAYPREQEQPTRSVPPL